MRIATVPLPARGGREAERAPTPVAARDLPAGELSAPDSLTSPRARPRLTRVHSRARVNRSAQAYRWARVHRRARLGGVLAVGSLLLATLLAPAAVTAVATPLAVGGILLGTPHGAVDHMVPGWLVGRALRPRVQVIVLAGYVGVVALAVLALRYAPTPTVITFLAVSAWHFGRGEVAAAAQAAGRPVPSARHDLPPVVAHGLVTVLLPMLARPELSREVLGALAPGWAVPPGLWRVAGLALVICGVLVALASLLRRGRVGEAGELVLLATLFGCVHPFAAFGVYFGAWHARATPRGSSSWPLAIARWLSASAGSPPRLPCRPCWPSASSWRSG